MDLARLVHQHLAGVVVRMTRREQRGGKRNFWTAIDDQILRDGFDTLTLAELCRKLGRKPSAVAARAAVVGLDAHGECSVLALQRAWFGGGR